MKHKIVQLNEIASNNFNLSPAAYIEQPFDDRPVLFKKGMQKIIQALVKVWVEEAPKGDMRKFLKGEMPETLKVGLVRMRKEWKYDVRI